MNTASNWQQLFDKTEQFRKRQPWHILKDNQFFAVQDPFTGEYGFCSVTGSEGAEVGLSVYIGSNGLDYLTKIIAGDVGECMYMEQRSILLNFIDKNELTEEDIALAQKGNSPDPDDGTWPQFRSFKPGFYPWYLDEEEVRFMSVILGQAVELVESEESLSKLLDLPNGRILTRKMGKKGKWENEEIALESFSLNWTVPLQVNELELQLLKRLVKNDLVSLEFDASVFPNPIEKGAGMRPYFPTLVLSVERLSGKIIRYQLINRETYEADLQNIFMDSIREFGIIPGEIFVRGKIRPIIEPVAEKLGIRLSVTKHLPDIINAQQELAGTLLEEMK